MDIEAIIGGAGEDRTRDLLTASSVQIQWNQQLTRF